MATEAQFHVSRRGVASVEVYSMTHSMRYLLKHLLSLGIGVSQPFQRVLT